MRPFGGRRVVKEEPPPSPPPTRELLEKSEKLLEEANYEKRLEEHQSRTAAKKESITCSEANEIPGSKCPSRRVAAGGNPATSTSNSILQAFLTKVKTTQKMKALQNDVDKAALLRYKEMEWRQGRLKRGQEVPDTLTFEQVKKRERPPSADALELEMQQGNESNQKYLRRLSNVRDRMVEFNNMLEIEGEDCWDEETDDSFEQKVEEKLDSMHFERSPSKPAPIRLGV